MLTSCFGEEETVEIEEVVPVKTTTIDTSTQARTFDHVSLLEPWQRSYIAADQAGRVVEINAREGQEVSEGMPLVQMEDAQLRQARVQYEQVKLQYNRLDTLHEAGAVAKSELDQVRAEYEAQKTQLQHLEDNTTLTAPFSGIITDRSKEPGDLYTMSPDPAGGGPSILTLQQFDPMKAVIHLSERFFPQVEEDMEARVKADIFPDTTFQGEVVTVFPTIDPITRTFRIELSIDNPAHMLRPGMFSTVELTLDRVSSLLIPKSALVHQPGTQERFAFLAKDGYAERINPEFGREVDEWIEVTSGLQVGNQLITTGQGRLIDGMEIDVRE